MRSQDCWMRSASMMPSSWPGRREARPHWHLGIRHPERVRALVLVSANVPGPHQSRGMPPRRLFKAIFGNDPVLWAIITYLPGLMARLSQVLQVPEGVKLIPGDEEKLSRAMKNVLLGRRRVAGEVFDAYVSNPGVNAIDLSRVPIPMLVMHARDDSGPPYASAVETARRIPDGRLVTVERGGHLMLGEHGDAIREVARFLAEHSPAAEARHDHLLKRDVRRGLGGN
jgi:pimeloyl-ACP methyl ester carboxylesterase